jgi:hypothetical protein
MLGLGFIFNTILSRDGLTLLVNDSNNVEKRVLEPSKNEQIARQKAIKIYIISLRNNFTVFIIRYTNYICKLLLCSK